MKENEKTLTEADLSDVKNSIAALCKKYISGSFFDKLVDTSGIKIAKDILLGDLKEQIGHGTAAAAAKKFANAISLAKSTPAVDTVLANYMLKGDGMGAGIGYNESEEAPMKSFQEFLSEARKAEKIEAKPSQEMIAEAIKTVEAEGYTVNKIEEKSDREYTQEQINEAIEVAKKHGYRVVTQEQIDEAKKIVESKGFKVIEESEKIVKAKLHVPIFDYNKYEVADLIKYALQNKGTPAYLRNKFGEVVPNDREVTVELFDTESPADDLKIVINDFIEDNPGLESEYDEDLLDYYSVLLNKSRVE